MRRLRLTKLLKCDVGTSEALVRPKSERLMSLSPMSRPALERVERGRYPVTALLREQVYAVTGVYPSWLATQDGAIRSCDGYPFDPNQLSRREKCC